MSAESLQSVSRLQPGVGLMSTGAADCISGRPVITGDDAVTCPSCPVITGDDAVICRNCPVITGDDAVTCRSCPVITGDDAVTCPAVTGHDAVRLWSFVTLSANSTVCTSHHSDTHK